MHGDLSVLSFHATKVFNTLEGGAIISPDAQTKLRIDQLKNFGFVDEVTVVAAGINGKMNEISSALGLLQLKHLAEAVQKRRAIDTAYRAAFADLRGLICLSGDTVAGANYSYFPVLLGPNYALSRDALYDKLRARNIFPRRYFYPLISDFPMYRDLPSATHANLPVAADAAARILCLPIYPNLTVADQQRIIDVVRSA